MTKNAQIDAILQTPGVTEIALAARGDHCIKEHESFKLLPFIDEIANIENDAQKALLNRLKNEIETIVNTVGASQTPPILGGLINLAVNGGRHFISYFYSPHTHELIIADPANWLLEQTTEKLKAYFKAMFPEKEEVKIVGHITDQQAEGSQHCLLLGIHNLAHASNFFKEPGKTLADYNAAIKTDPINANKAKEIKYELYEDAALDIICKLPQEKEITYLGSAQRFDAGATFNLHEYFTEKQKDIITNYKANQTKCYQEIYKKICINTVNLIARLETKIKQAKQERDDNKAANLEKSIKSFKDFLSQSEVFLTKKDYIQVQIEKAQADCEKTSIPEQKRSNLSAARNKDVQKEIPAPSELKRPTLRDIVATQDSFLQAANNLEANVPQEINKLQKIKRIIHDFFVTITSQHSPLSRYNNYSIKHTVKLTKNLASTLFSKVYKPVDKGDTLSPKEVCAPKKLANRSN